MSSEPLLLLANLGAEETLGDDDVAEQQSATTEASRRAASLWRLLFGERAELLDAAGRPVGSGSGNGTGSETWWPPSWGPVPTGLARDWLEAPGGAVAWLVTEAAAEMARERGRSLQGPEPVVVRRVHDKAFAQQIAQREGLVPEALAGSSCVLEPEQLADETTTQELLQQAWARWPEWLRQSRGSAAATLKPRLGCSGRGRVAFDPASPEPLGAARRRLAARGGAIFEPWLTRRLDLSVQLYLGAGTKGGAEGVLRLLGTLEPRMSGSGVPRAHRGLVDSRGRVRAGTEWDDALLEAAVSVAGAAREAGFHGPCGLDALVFEDAAGRPVLRPVVEWNARFTLGSIVVGGVRRALPFLKQRLGLEPGELRAFEWRWQTPAGSAPESTAEVAWVPLGQAEAAGAIGGAGVAFARDTECLEAWLEAQGI